MAREFVPSPQQAHFFDWVRNGSGSALLTAVAGAGKTTTLVESLALTRGNVTFTAFNKAISNEIEAKVAAKGGDLAQRVRCKTFHALGFGALGRARPIFRENGRLNVEGRKAALVEACGTPEEAATCAFNLFDLARQRAYDPAFVDASSFAGIVEHYGLEEAIEETGYNQEDMQAFAHALLVEGAKFETPHIDFTDMIWGPLVLNLRPWATEWIYVDEAQDTNPARRELARLLVRRNGRAVFVGDSRQAIYGFTGADNNAMEIIRDDFGAVEMPLTVSYRCPRAVVAHAHNWVSHIEAHETAPEGVVRSLPGPHAIVAEARKGDAVLCRNTAPIVQLAFALIRAGKRAHVEGRDIGRGLAALTKKWKGYENNLEGFLAKLDEWKEQQMEMLIERNRALAAQTVEDKAQTLHVLAETCETLSELREKISSIFDDTQPDEAPNRITLATIHRSKGREWKRVYWLGHNTLCPSKFARQPWEREQETNLQYVATTRAQEELVLVN